MSTFLDSSRGTASVISNVAEKIIFQTADSAVEKARKTPRSSKDVPFSKNVIQHALLEAKILGPGPYRTFEAILSFLPGQSLIDESGQPGIIYAKNESIRKRAGGIGDSTVRAHISHLVKCGILERKTRLNHKRWKRRNRQNLTVETFGLSVAPLVRRFDELVATAKQKNARHDALKLSIHQLRTKMNEAQHYLSNLQNQGIHNLDALEGELSDLRRTSKRIKDQESAETIVKRLDDILEQLSSAALCSPLETSAVDARFKRPIQDSINESLNERGKENEELSAANRQTSWFAYKGTSRAHPETANSNHAGTSSEFKEASSYPSGPGATFGGFGLKLQKEVPDSGSNLNRKAAKADYTWISIELRYDHVKDYAPNRCITNESEFYDAIQRLLTPLQISRIDWDTYVQKFGRLEASLVIAYMTQDGTKIHNFGAYFHTMLLRAEQGKIYPLRLLARRN